MYRILGPHGEHHFVLAYDKDARTSEKLHATFIEVKFPKWKSDYDQLQAKLSTAINPDC